MDKFNHALASALGNLPRSEKLLLGLSGGADSVCLFHLLKKGGFSFSAAHINHGIRGEEALRDEEFCRRLSEENGIAFHLLRADVPALSRESGESVEETARRVRYTFFEQVMRENGITVLLTAHNADDNAETLLLSLTRGCAPSGACGIPPVRALSFGEVRRPLLPFSKAEITGYCAANSHEYVTDSTNTDTSYARNRVRHNILPELASINPDFLAAFSRFTAAERSDCSYLDSEADRILSEWNGIIDAPKLSSLPYPIASRILLSAAYKAGAAPEALHIREMLVMAEKKRSSLSLPGGVLAVCENGRLTFKPECRARTSAREIYPDYPPVPLKTGDNRIGSGVLGLVLGELTNDSIQIYNLSTSAIINIDRIKGQLYARPRREGDRILIGGMHRSVKKLISEKAAHLDLDQRRSLPVVCCGDEVVWVPWLEAADPYRGGNSPTTVYYYFE